MTKETLIRLEPELTELIERLRTKMRMIVSHATGGHSADIDASVNDICVRISAHRNQIYQAGKDAALRALEQDSKSGMKG